MEMEQIMACLLAEISSNREHLKEEIGAGEELLEEEMLPKMETNQERTEANQEKMEARIDASSEKSEVLRNTLVFRMDIHQARTLSTQEEMKAKMDIHQEKIEAAIHSIRSELEETIKHRLEDVLFCVDQKTPDLGKEVTEKTDGKHVDLQAVKTSLDTRTKFLQETLADTKNDLHEEARTMKAEIRINQERMEAKTETIRREFQTQLKEVEAGAECGRGTGTGMGAPKSPKFDGTTSWAVFQRQFDTLAEHNCCMCQEKSTYLITALQGRDTDVLHGVPKGATYEGTFKALEDRFGDQHLTAAYCNQLKSRTQTVGESLQ
jgi:type VI protein secretion system component Hcp